MRYILTFILMCVAAQGQVRYGLAKSGQVASSAAYDAAIDGITISMWIKPDAIPATQLFFMNSRTVGMDITTAGSIDVYTYVGAYGARAQSPSFKITTGSVHHVVATISKDSLTAALYVNGELSAIDTNGPARTFGAASLIDVSRASTTNSPFYGTIEDLRVYQGVFTAGDVAEFYARPWTEMFPGKTMVLRTCQQYGIDTGAIAATCRNFAGYTGLVNAGNPLTAPGLVQSIRPMEEDNQ